MKHRMACHLFALTIDANDPLRLASFWIGVLEWTMASDSRKVMIQPTEDTGFNIRFRATPALKTSQNHMHFDLTSTSLEDQQRSVAKSIGLGAQHIDIGQGSEESHVVLADLEGNEFCVSTARESVPRLPPDS